MNVQLPSLRRRLLTAFALTLLTLWILLTAIYALMSDRLTQIYLVDRMQVAIQVAWDAYHDGPDRLITSIQALARNAASDGPLSTAALPPLLDALPEADFAAAVSPEGLTLGHTNPDRVGQAPPFPEIAAEALRTGQVRSSSELVTADFVAAHMPQALHRLYVPAGCQPGDAGCTDVGIVQVVAVPVRTDTGDVAVVAGILLNNTEQIPSAASERLPGSYLSVAVEGIRISSNIITRQQGLVETGSQQSSGLRRAVKQGERYYGTVPVGAERHYVAADPIHNAAGQVIGALSIGLPQTRFAMYTDGAQALMLACGLLAVLLSLGIAHAMARQLVQPITGLERDIVRLTTAARSHDLARATQLIDPPPALYSREVQALHQAFQTLAGALVEQTKKTETYLHQIEDDRAELQALTGQLQEAKAALEAEVEHRTFELKQAVAELKQANQLKSNFLASVSHELRTPLNSIIGFSEMLIDELAGPVNAKQREYLDHILSSGNHLLQLISDLLHLSQIEQGRMSLELQPVALQELIESVHQRCIPSADAAGLKLEVNCDPGVPPIMADPTRVKEILDNLLSNAIKFTPQGGRIWVRLSRADDMAVIEVEDTGIGIRPEDQTAVFNEFVQAESGYRRRHEGVGLGLPLSKKLAEMHGGRIELKSQLGKGTVVRVYLPLPKGVEQSGGSDPGRGG
ncbi:MAG: ATP-binding protein [Symbiobacterium sp.]|uniref:ATP-binding protein n=1 Tax=Symbiobacterium sp. TaxID=1971213 RepID=UPI0034643BEB